MSDFVNKWIRCNICFKDFDSSGGTLTSCGHFFCNRSDCKIVFGPNDKVTCPICKMSCNCISLDQKLPEEILQYFEDPDVIFQRALEVYHFQEQQRNICRNHFENQNRRIRELEEMIDEIRAENNRLKTAITHPAERESPHKEPVTKSIQRQITSQKRREFSITTNDQEVSVSRRSQQGHQPTKLFTPTLASRLQSLTGRRLYQKVSNE